MHMVSFLLRERKAIASFGFDAMFVIFFLSPIYFSDGMSFF
jgi:hypothetical protein|uniref:Transmembrane protein n=1 Tax=Arabidopsis thaliana TaxID=3702 RepID=Q56ZG2_ARATH|nr:hypothetical protein [Arabidopsis thaliana]